MLKLILGIGFVFSLLGPAFGQDTIRVMYYNLLNFPDESPERVSDLRQILGYAQPDVLVVCELQSSEGADLILNSALNVWGEDKYEAAEYMDGPYTDNMLFYNSDLLGLLGQEEIPTDVRDHNEFQLYYKNPSLSAASDTLYLNLYGLHLKAGSGFFNQRKEQAIVLKYHLNSLSNAENIFVGGDFNFYSGNESGCLAIRETGDINLFDPIASIGDWNNNVAYANIHTQSTRTAPLADGAGGGMDDRFDLIFTTADVFDNSNGLELIEGSYQALGQDGTRFNSTITSPYNPSVPDSVSNALYYMSDHLPVLLDLKTDYTASISTELKENLQWYYNATSNELVFNQNIEDAQFLLYDLSGQLIFNQTVDHSNSIKFPRSIKNGLFCWNLVRKDKLLRGKVVKQ